MRFLGPLTGLTRLQKAIPTPASGTSLVITSDYGLLDYTIDGGTLAVTYDSMEDGQIVTVLLTGDTSDRSITFGAEFSFGPEGAPTIISTSSKTILTFVCISDGVVFVTAQLNGGTEPVAFGGLYDELQATGSANYTIPLRTKVVITKIIHEYAGSTLVLSCSDGVITTDQTVFIAEAGTLTIACLDEAGDPFPITSVIRVTI